MQCFRIPCLKITNSTVSQESFCLRPTLFSSKPINVQLYCYPLPCARGPVPKSEAQSYQKAPIQSTGTQMGEDMGRMKEVTGQSQ